LRSKESADPGSHPQCAHGLGDVLHRLVAEIVPGKRKLVSDLLVDAAGDADTARLRQPLQPRRYIDAIANEVVALDHHVAEINADAKLHPVAFGQAGSQGRHGLLDFHCRTHRFDRAGELRNNAVAGACEYSAFMLADQPGDQFAGGV
jgi:hypothetical protein